MLDIIKTRRSIRKFEDREVEKDKLKAILQGALTAPSSRGKRPWNLIAVTEKEQFNQLSQCREVGSSFLADASACIYLLLLETLQLQIYGLKTHLLSLPYYF